MRNSFLFATILASIVFSPYGYCLIATPCGTVATINTPTLSSTSPIPATGETPQSIACVYGLAPYIPGCPIAATTQNLRLFGGSGVIAVTEGYDDPYALQELNAFSAQYHLPLMSQCTDLTKPSATPCFATVYANGTAPAVGYGLGPVGNPDLYIKEHALDIEMAHAMAPNASIVIVEAPTYGQFDTPSIFSAVQCAGQIVQAMGGGVVSNSWGTAKGKIHEYPSEVNNDIYFQKDGVVFTASSGDTLAPANYPAVSPNVISVGGTEFVRDRSGNFVKEIAWTGGIGSDGLPVGSSGGPSVYEPRPAFQNFVMKIVGAKRGTPDVSTIGKNINTYYITCTNYPSGCQAIWIADGGTSYASPLMGGIINAAGSHAQSSQAELNLIYQGAQTNYHAYWHDILSGNNGYPALPGYDFVTGLGSPRGYLGK
ncbi:MAG: S53 family peptidase [Gammaproteobacteria bacterium]